MELIISVLVALIALAHLGFLVLEMFFWTKPLGRRVFVMSADKAKNSKVLAANQGLYNGFLAAGLIWSLMQPVMSFAHQLQIFFLSCVLVAGLYGAYSTESRKVLFLQALPATLTLILVTW